MIDPDKCMACVRKHKRQCSNTKKPDSDYCGIHETSKNRKRIDEIVFTPPPREEDEEYNVSRILKIQKNVRRWLILQRVKRRTNPFPPVNITDFLYDVHFLEMPECFYFDFIDVDKKRYFFDIRALKTHTETSGMTNPYTRNEIPVDNQTILRKKIASLQETGVEVKIEEPTFKSYNDKVEMEIFDVFQKINALDNYVDHKWFLELDENKLRRLYLNCSSIFNFRSQLSESRKAELVKDTKMFVHDSSTLNFIKSKTALREICISVFEKFATEGKTKDDCKVGIMLMLTAFVEVSPNAASSQEMAIYVQDMIQEEYY